MENGLNFENEKLPPINEAQAAADLLRELTAKQALHNFAKGDKEQLKTAQEFVKPLDIEKTLKQDKNNQKTH